jgi:hypothetical protein
MRPAINWESSPTDPPRARHALPWAWRVLVVSLAAALVCASMPWGADAQSGPRPGWGADAPRDARTTRRAAAISGLHVVGNQIRDGNNQPVRLRGVNEPSSEYACIFDYGVFNHRVAGVSDDTSVQALLSWKINMVRLPLNEDCWLNINTAGLDPANLGANYQLAINQYVTKLTAAGIAVILDLHWAAPGNTRATGQLPMANRDHSITFWQQVANAFKSNTGVIFDLYNEPYPDNNVDSVAAWTCLRDGSPPGGPTASCPGSGSNYAAAGMQELLNAVRGTGATNLVLVAGVTYTGHLSQWMTYKPNDPLNNLAASVHIYPGGSQCSDLVCINAELGPLVQSYPLIAGEIGQSSCAVNLINPVIDWLESKSQHFLAWQWINGSCDGSDAEGNFYGLITNHATGAPTAGYGQGYKDRLAALVASQPSFTATASVQPGSVAPGGNLLITANVTSATAITAVVVVYEYDPGGNFLDQQFFTGQAFAAGQTKIYQPTWPVPLGAASGAYTIRIGVFESTFTDLLYWNDNAAQFTVGAATPTSTATRTPTPTATRTSTPTATPPPATPTRTPTALAITCAPRPGVGVAAVPNGDGRLRVTLSTSANAGSAPNLLQTLQFTRLDNAVVEIGSQVGVAGTFNVLPAATNLTLFVRRAAPGAASMVEFTVLDGCGPWPTFVGGGPSAF